MLRIIGLNIDKKFSLFSIIFMMLSILIITLICCINASFNFNDYDTLSNYKGKFH